MTVLSRGARPRRGGRRPGWLLLTALLVLAIAASSALVFTNRVELLKLAVILALWAAVVAAFVSVIYRRQSDVDQARARDMKMVYDLQLDREISARRDYELTVESQLRRELAAELRAQAADEVAALRSELSALRTTLEILFDADLGDRPALETERTTVRAYSDWAHHDENASARREFGDRFTSAHPEDANSRTSENPIIDVPEVGVPPASGPLVAHRDAGEGAAEAFHTAEANADAYRGSHWRPSEVGTWPSRPRHDQAAQPGPRSQNAPEPLPPEPAPQFETRFAPPEPEPAASRDQSQPARHVRDWQPVRPEGDRRPPATAGSDEVPAPDDNYSSPFAEPAEASPAPEPPIGRHYGTPGPVAVPPDPAVADWRPARAGASARHSTDSGVYDLAARPAPAPESTLPPAARHRTADEESDTDGPRTGGQSVADLLARLQAGSTSGGRRRRRED